MAGVCPVTAKALTRKITRKQALSYRKTVPNRLGVTALAELNGRGAWKRRYDLTKQILSGKRVSGSARRNPDGPGRSQEESAMANPKYTPRQRTAMAKMSPARRAAFKRMLGRSPDISTLRRNAKKATAAKRGRGRVARRNPAAAATKPKKKTKAQIAAQRRASLEKARAMKKAYKIPVGSIPYTEEAYGPSVQDPEEASFWRGVSAGPGRRPPKAGSKRAYLEEQVLNKGKTYAQADAAWRRSKGLIKSRPRGPRTYGRGRYKAVDLQLGKRRIPTYLYRSRKGRVAHIPEHAIMGYPSKYAVDLESQTPAGKARYDTRKQKLDERRQTIAEKRKSLILQGRDPFSPNPADVMTWEEWKSMNPNKKTPKKAKKGGRKKPRTAAQKAATKKMIAASRKARKAPKSKAKGRGRKPAAAKRRASAKKHAHRARSMTIIMKPNAGGAFEGYEENRRGRRRRKSRRYRGNASAKQIAAAKRNIKKALAARWGKGAAKGRAKTARKGKGRGRKAGWSSTYMTLYSKNAMRSYNQNAVGGWVEGLKEALKIGGIVVVGFAAHRALSKVLSEQVLGKLDAFKSGTLGSWRDAIAGLIVAAAGVPIAVKLIPGESAAAGAGMAASFLHGIIIKALNEAGQPDVASYLSGYREDTSPAYRLSGMGEYYTFRPHQLFPVSGMGEYITQTPGLRYNQLVQPAAGFGQNNGGAIVTQPAAGTGEYLVYGAEGVGDYSEVPIAPTPMSWDEGVLPTLDAAERALNVMEAAAGVGSSEIPAQVTVNPVDYAQPIGDEPRGSRSGVFDGKGGIFG